MSDAAPRPTPYEMVFLASPEFEARTFPQIRDEAAERGVDPVRRERFDFLSRAGEAVRGVIPSEAPPEAFDQYRALLYHAFNFWRFDRRVYVLEPAVARYLVEGAPSLEGWELELPHPSMYLQLPPALFWGSIAPDSTPEPVDGFFATIAEVDDPLGAPYRRLEVLAVLGVRRDRAGFSVIPFDTEVGPGIAADWAEAPGREGGADFENVLPGGELSGLYSLLTTAEVLKLLARALRYVATHPEDVAAEKARIPYFRVSLGSDSP